MMNKRMSQKWFSILLGTILLAIVGRSIAFACSGSEPYITVLCGDQSVRVFQAAELAAAIDENPACDQFVQASVPLLVERTEAWESSLTNDTYYLFDRIAFEPYSAERHTAINNTEPSRNCTPDRAEKVGEWLEIKKILQPYCEIKPMLGCSALPTARPTYGWLLVQRLKTANVPFILSVTGAFIAVMALAGYFARRHEQNTITKMK